MLLVLVIIVALSSLSQNGKCNIIKRLIDPMENCCDIPRLVVFILFYDVKLASPLIQEANLEDLFS